jgi:molybdopterin molybdotransferase
VEQVDLLAAGGRVLAEDVVADRDQPSVNRSARDGFAIRAADVPGRLKVAGESRAGAPPPAPLRPGEAVEIMTGAALPEGADAVIMVEHVRREGGDIVYERAAAPGENYNPRGCEVRAGQVVLRRGQRIGYRQMGMLAATGSVQPRVFRRPRAAILPTGDEIIAPEQTPLPHQIRNSNSYSLWQQVTRSGGDPVLLDPVPDDYEATRRAIEQALETDLVLLSGGVSAGKYDVVEQVLGDLGAEFYFDRVLIQPGQPLVFGRLKDRFFFGLPGNPASTMVTFELFARAALELLGGCEQPELPLAQAILTQDFRQRPGLRRFLPAWLDGEGGRVTPVPWHGSGDLAALVRSNCFMVTEPERECWRAGELIGVLLI